jgi:hypothetical protein
MEQDVGIQMSQQIFPTVPDLLGKRKYLQSELVIIIIFNKPNLF